LYTHDSNLADIFIANVCRFFANPGTVWAAAAVFNEIAEKTILPKTTGQTLSEIVTSGLVQESYHLYLTSSIGIDAFTSISFLAITLAESEVEKLLEPLTTLNQKFLEIMLFLLDTDMSSRTFNFWASFAEASVDIGDGHQGDLWLQQVLPKLLEKSAWRDDLDYEELSAYRTDVVEVFEAICEVLERDTLNSVVTEWLDAVTRKEDSETKVVVSI
jgi:hypothetical protein